MNHRLQVNARPHLPELVAAKSPTCRGTGLQQHSEPGPIGGPLPYDFGDHRRQPVLYHRVPSGRKSVPRLLAHAKPPSRSVISQL
jgi:hypothetical protein